MGVREDLLKVARLSADAAKSPGVVPEYRLRHSEVSKTALEAVVAYDAATAPSVDEITKALNDLDDALREAGFERESIDMAPAPFLRYLLDVLNGYAKRSEMYRQVAQSYIDLREYVETLAADWERSADERRAPPDDAARRLARRTRALLEATIRPPPAND